MATREEATRPEATACAPERRRKIYRAAAQRLQRFADSHPEVRFDADTLAITFATDSLNEVLASFSEGACGLEVVGQAFDGYEQALIEASELRVLLRTTIIALRESSELIERYVWSAAPEEAAEAQENNHRVICALKVACPVSHASRPPLGVADRGCMNDRRNCDDENLLVEPKRAPL